MREGEARDLAARADLLLFVVDHDLIRSEYEPLVALARQGKRSIVVLNKQDRLRRADRDAILAKLRERLAGIVPRGRRRRRRRRAPADPGPGHQARRLVADRLRRRAPRHRRARGPDRRRPQARGGRPPRGQPAAPGPPDQQGGAGAARRRSATGRRRRSIDKFQWITAGHRLRQPDPRARPAGQRRGPVPDDLGAGRRSTASRSRRPTSR